MQELKNILNKNETIPMKNEEPLKINSIPKCRYCKKEYKLGWTEEEYLPDCICQYKREEQKRKGKNLVGTIQSRKAVVNKRFYNKTFSNFKKESNVKAYNFCHSLLINSSVLSSSLFFLSNVYLINASKSTDVIRIIHTR